MAKSTTCRYKGKIISVDDALALPKRERVHMSCIKCHQPVNPHNASGPGKKPSAAHFEHYAQGGGRNPNCPLSDPARS